jgi:hypothetical protein
MKNTFLVVSLVLIMVIFLSSCGGSGNTVVSTATVPEATSDAPVQVVLSFPDGTPKLNSSGILKCVVINDSAVNKNVSIDINAPKTAFTLESGSYSWSGNVPGNSETTVIEATVKTYHTGHWQVDAGYHIDTEPDSYGGDFISTIYVNLGVSSSEWGTTPPWQK